MMKEETKSLQMLLPSNETTVTLDGKFCVMDTQNLFFGMPVQALDRFPLQLSSKCMIIVLKGEVTSRMNFRECVAGDNTCAVFATGTIVERVEMSPDAKVIHISYATENSSSVSGVFPLQPLQVDLLKTAYDMLRDIMTDSAFAAGREDAAGKCVELMESIAIGSDRCRVVTEKTSRQEEIVTRFLQCVKENYREYRELSFYAEQMGLSLKYMSRVVFQQTGRHPSQWIKDHVILDAKAMLRNGNYSVQQVADALHFPNQSFFGKYFKEAVGVSPKKWR